MGVTSFTGSTVRISVRLVLKGGAQFVIFSVLILWLNASFVAGDISGAIPLPLPSASDTKVLLVSNPFSKIRFSCFPNKNTDCWIVTEWIYSSISAAEWGRKNLEIERFGKRKICDIVHDFRALLWRGVVEGKPNSICCKFHLEERFRFTHCSVWGST